MPFSPLFRSSPAHRKTLGFRRRNKRTPYQARSKRIDLFHFLNCRCDCSQIFCKTIRPVMFRFRIFFLQTFQNQYNISDYLQKKKEMSHITNFIIIMSFAIIFFIFFQLGDNMLLRLSLAVVNICFLMHLLFKYQKNIQKERVIRGRWYSSKPVKTSNFQRTPSPPTSSMMTWL